MSAPGSSNQNSTVICQAAVQQEQQQNCSCFRCCFHHHPDVQVEPQNRIQQSPASVCLSVSASVCVCVCVCVCGCYWQKGQSMSWTDESDMFHVNPPHVYFDSTSCVQDKQQLQLWWRTTCTVTQMLITLLWEENIKNSVVQDWTVTSYREFYPAVVTDSSWIRVECNGIPLSRKRQRQRVWVKRTTRSKQLTEFLQLTEKLTELMGLTAKHAAWRAWRPSSVCECADLGLLPPISLL